MVIWITGLPGSGKTTLANLLIEKLRQSGAGFLLLDGDEIRQCVDDQTLTYSRHDRLVNAKRISRLAEAFERQGLTIVVATVSLFSEIHTWNRAHFKAYFEVLLDAEESIRVARKPSLYEKDMVVGKSGSTENAFDLPLNPELLIKNNENSTDKLREYAEDIRNRVRSLTA